MCHFKQTILYIWHKGSEDFVLFQANCMESSVCSVLPLKYRDCEFAVTLEEEQDAGVFCEKFIQQRLKKINYIDVEIIYIAAEFNFLENFQLFHRSRQADDVYDSSNENWNLLPLDVRRYQTARNPFLWMRNMAGALVLDSNFNIWSGPSLQANFFIKSRPASENKSPPSKFIFMYLFILKWCCLNYVYGLLLCYCF